MSSANRTKRALVTKRDGEFILKMEQGRVTADPRHGHIQKQGCYASDWAPEHAARILALVKAEVAPVPVLTERWWICDDDDLPDRPEMPCKFCID